VDTRPDTHFRPGSAARVTLMKNEADILIVGLGNPILGDDGIGWRVAERVQQLLPTAQVTCLSLGGLSLMEHLIGYESVVIIDSIQTRDGQLGDVYTFDLTELPDFSAGHTTAAHDTSLQTAIRLGRKMGAELPERIMVVAIETDRVYDFSEELSAPVAAAVPPAVHAVLNLLENNLTATVHPGSASQDRVRGVK
jgi:hydrogenase maturation protease